MSSIPGVGRPSGGGKDNPLQYSCLENSMDRGAWQVTVHGVAKSQTRLSDFTCFHFLLSLQTWFKLVNEQGEKFKAWQSRLGEEGVVGQITAPIRLQS